MKSDPSQRAGLLALLGAIEEREAAASLDGDDPGVIALARHHRLAPLLSQVRGGALPSSLAQAFRRDRLMTAARNTMLAAVAGECIRALSAEHVRVLLLKGLDYETRLYRAPGARPTGDVDLLVPEADRRRAFEVLDRLGFEPRAAAPGFDDPDYHEVAWTRGGVEVDLHMALAPLARCRIDYRSVWAEAAASDLAGTQVEVLSLPHAAIFHALHMAIDHFAVPAIYLVDFAMLWNAGIDAAQVNAVAASWRVSRPLHSALALAAAFLPGRMADPPRTPRRTRSIIRSYGASPTRAEQLIRKFRHFDRAADGFRYVIVQSRRNLREQVEQRIRKRRPRERLNLRPQR